MTVRTFWLIFIKILGIWLVLSSLNVIPEFVSTIMVFSGDQIGEGFVITIILLLLTITIYLLLLRLFVFKTAWLVDKLKLEKDFNDAPINLNIEYRTILTIATIVIGGLMLVDSLPILCKQIFLFFQQKNIFRESPSSGWIIFYFTKTLLGYLLMTNSRTVVAFIQRNSAKHNEPELKDLRE